MTAETTENLSLTSQEENEILSFIFKNLDERTTEIIASLRMVSLTKDKKVLERIQDYVTQSLSHEMVKKAARKRGQSIPPDSWERIQHAIDHSLCHIFSEKNIEPKHVLEFYKNIARFIRENAGIIAAASFLRAEAWATYRNIQSIIPDFWIPGRWEKFNALWMEEVVEFARNLQITQTFDKTAIKTLGSAIPVVGIGVTYALYTHSPEPILYSLTGYLSCLLIWGILGWTKTNKHLSAICAYVKAQEKALSRFRLKMTTIKHRTPIYTAQLCPLPSLAEIRAGFVATSASTDPPHASDTKEEKEEDSTTKVRKKLIAQTIAPPPSISTSTLSAPSPIIDLSEALGHVARYAGEKDMRNTLFQFKATSEEDIRYVFIHPGLEAQVPTQEQWLKFMEKARYARLASKRNKQGIKTLTGKYIADPETGIRYPAVELKILGANGSGELRLLGAMISVEQLAGRYNVYVFNTLWNKGDLPTHFDHPLLQSSPAAAQAAFAQPNPFTFHASSGGLPSYAEAIKDFSKPFFGDISPPTYEEAISDFSSEAVNASL